MWITKWGYTVAAKASKPGIWRLKSSGYLVHVRMTNPRTGKRINFTKQVHDASLHDAEQVRLDGVRQLRDQITGTTAKKTRFSAFAASLFERKVAAGDLRSAKTRERWEDALTIHIIPAIGDLFVSEIRFADLQRVREAWGVRIHADPAKRFEYVNSKGKKKIGKVRISPRTANGWLSILRVVCAAMTAEHELAINPSKGIQDFDTAERPTYTDEEPNALTTEQAGKFLATMRAKRPEHYAMAYVGFITGLRPSSLRPLRRVDDVDWEAGLLRIRRSNAIGDEVLDRTKTGRRQTIHLPPEAIETLREHLAFIEAGKNAKMKTSPYLFPSRTGGMRSRSALDKPFRAVARLTGIPIALTPRGMRRTFQDLARGAGVHDVVTRSISGHSTDRMQGHYSTAQASEQRGALSRVISLVDGKKDGKGGLHTT